MFWALAVLTLDAKELNMNYMKEVVGLAILDV